jgi:alanyl-tRNA synthetase
MLSGSEVFTLYDTYGFPMDLTRLMAGEKGLTVDEDGYARLMEQQKERAREARKGGEAGLTPEGWIEIKPAAGTEFVGYDQEQTQVQVCRYKPTESENGSPAYLLILDRTPFYAESGGQVGDTGTMHTSSGKELFVENTFKWNDMVIHRVRVNVLLTRDDLTGVVTAAVDTGLRAATRRNHSATHLLQAALRKLLGEHVQQSGSRVDPSGLRFDFTHFKALTPGELVSIENQVNEWIMADMILVTDIKDLAAAKAEGATALFGEKYGDRVRVVTISPISKELCGGTHVRSTGQIGLFHCTAETSISAGIRRIEAITGKSVSECLLAKEQHLGGLTGLVKVPEDKLLDRMKALMETVRELETKVSELSTAKAAGAVQSIFDESHKGPGSFPWSVKNMGDLDKSSFDRITDAVSDGIRAQNLTTMVVVIGARVDGKVLFAACAGGDAPKKFGVHCGELVKTAAQKAGGGGGGSPVRAQAGGKDPSKLDPALESVESILKEKARAS